MRLRVTAVAVLVLTGCAGGSAGDPTPVRPSSSSSGTTVTSVLTPRGATPSVDALRAAADILRMRARALDGTREAEVTVVGDHLEVRVDALATAGLKQLLANGRLEFRRVIAVEPILPQGPACVPVAPDDVGPATEEIRACDKDGLQSYRLAPAEVVGSDIRAADADVDPTTGTQAQINLTFTDTGQAKWTALTKELVSQPSPTDQLGIVLDGVVLSAPVIQSVITGDAQITGQFTVAESEALAAVLSYGALPFSFDVTTRQ